MQTLTETSRVGVFHFLPALTFLAGAGATKTLAGAFLSFPTFASTRPAFGYLWFVSKGLILHYFADQSVLSEFHLFCS